MSILSTEALNQPRAKRWGARGTPRCVAWACLAALLLASGGSAQDAADDRAAAVEKTPAAANSSGPIQYVGPDTYILRDSQGRIQAMPGMTYEDFMAAWKRSQQAAPRDRQSRYTIDSVAINGKTVGNRAELRLEATVRFLSDERIDVPLGLVGAILEGRPRFGNEETSENGEASGEKSQRADSAQGDYLDFDAERGGFVAHLSGRAGDRRTLSLDLLAPLTRDGAETSLALNCPRALTTALKLDVLGPVSDASVNSGALLSQEKQADGTTRLTAAGLVGEFRMTWSTADVADTELSSVLSAAGEIQVSIDGRNVRTDARLTVRSYGGSFDRFRVRLPRGATLIQNRINLGEKDPGYRLIVEDAAKGSDTRRPSTSGDQVVLVQLSAKQQGPVAVELSTEQPLQLSDADVAVKLDGFEVLGAVRQFGDVSLRVADDWQIRWDAGQYVRQVDTSELEPGLQQPGLTGAFQYDRQPWSLGVRVSPREIRVQVTPEYELNCQPDEARLRVHLTYQVLGARAYEFRVDLRGWERTAEPLESGGVIDRDRIMLTDGVLELPLSQPSLRRAEITFFLRRAVPRDARQIDLPLPLPVAESVATGDLIVRSTPGIELMPAVARSKGLTATPVNSDSDATTDDDRSEFRFRCIQPEASFAADRVSRARDLVTNVACDIEIRPELAQVRERIEYVVRFEPIAELSFEFPSEFRLEDEAMEVALVSIAANNETNGSVPRDTLLKSASVVNDGESSLDGRGRHVRVALPQPRLGQFAIELRYPLSRPSTTSSNLSWPMLLARPADGRVGDWRATVHTPRDLGISLDATDETLTWKQVETASAPAGRNQGRLFVATRPEQMLPLVLRSVDVNLPAATSIERAWLQTWLTGSTRQDRAAFRFRTTARIVTVELPPETAAEEVEVLLDGRPSESTSREAGRIAVQIAAPGEERGAEVDHSDMARSHTLELRYRRTSNDRILTRRRLTPPQMVGMKSLTDVYWQIVLPGDRHVIDSPPQLAAASQWQWLGSFWGRRPTHTQAELEEWVGASAQQAPSSAQNEYLYSGVAPVSSIELVTAPRWFIVLVSSGVVLAMSLTWIYAPAVRRRWVVVAIACLLAGLALAYPTPAMLLGQASVLGVALAALAMLIARLAARPTQWYLPLPGGSSHRQLTPHLTPRTESVVMGSMASAVASTAPTVSLPVSESKT